MLYLYIAGFTQFGLLLLGAIVTLNATWAEKYKPGILAAFVILGLIGVGTTIKVGLDANSSGEKLAKSIEDLRAATLEIARVQNLNDSLLQGNLVPANDLTPSHRCRRVIQDNDLLIFLGSNVVMATHFPFTVVKAVGYIGVVLSKDENGIIAVSFDVFDSHGNIIVRVVNGKYQVNKNIGLPPKRKDPSSLEVTDQSGRQVLNMRYLNKNALSIEAELYYPEIDSVPLILSRSKPLPVGKGENPFYGNCLVDSVIEFKARP